MMTMIRTVVKPNSVAPSLSREWHLSDLNLMVTDRNQIAKWEHESDCEVGTRGCLLIRNKIAAVLRRAL